MFVIINGILGGLMRGLKWVFWCGKVLRKVFVSFKLILVIGFYGFVVNFVILVWFLIVWFVWDLMYVDWLLCICIGIIIIVDCDFDINELIWCCWEWLI